MSATSSPLAPKRGGGVGALIATVLTERPPLPALAGQSHYRWLVVATVCVGAFLGQLDASIASLVLPTLEDVFHAPIASVEWVAISYLLTLAATVVVFGRLADLVGRKMLYTVGFLLFIAGSALCGLAPGLGWLIAFRVLQAIGAALLQSNSVAIITAAVGRAELGRAIGVQGAAQAVGLAIGPSVGGLLIAALGWQWVFFIAVPFGLLGAALGWFVLPLTAHRPSTRGERERFDWWGALLFGPAVALLLLALTYGNAWGWASLRLVLTAGLTVACLAGFVLVERRAASPLVDFALFCRRLFTTGLITGLLAYAVLFGSLFVLPFYFERVLGHGPAEAGLLLTPIPLALGLLAPFAGILTDRLGSRLPTVAGMLLSGLALAALALIPQPPVPGVLAGLAALGVGVGLFTPPNNSAIMGSVPRHRLGVAGGLLNMTRSLGTSLGVALTGTVLAVRLAAHAGAHVEHTLDVPPALLLPALHETLLFLAALALLAGLLSLTRGAPAAEPVDDEAKAAALEHTAG